MVVTGLMYGQATLLPTIGTMDNCEPPRRCCGHVSYFSLNTDTVARNTVKSFQHFQPALGIILDMTISGHWWHGAIFMITRGYYPYHPTSPPVPVLTDTIKTVFTVSRCQHVIRWYSELPLESEYRSWMCLALPSDHCVPCNWYCSNSSCYGDL